LTVAAPERLTADHDVGPFDCGAPELNVWLRRRALANQQTDASRTFVALDEGRVVGFYALAAGGVNVVSAPGHFRRNMPDPIPVVLLGRLAIDLSLQRRGLGRVLFRDAALRVINAADSIGVRGILVHAISEAARDFYLAVGFEPSPLEPMTLMVTLADLRAATTQARH
jgi:GNAT superfamily N-acetyltransferase